MNQGKRRGWALRRLLPQECFFESRNAVKIKSPKDLWAGLMFVAFGLFFLLVARHYRMGSASGMGPGYFPAMLGGLMALIGGVIAFQSFVIRGEKVPAFSFRPLFLVILSLLFYGYSLQSIGMVFALALLIFIAAFAGHEFDFKEVLILSVVAIFFSVLVFVKVLGLPYPLWPKFLG